jgi:hypothetical protein
MNLYIHVGEDVMVRSHDIIAILDKKSVESSEEFRKILRLRKSSVMDLSKGNFKSIVMTSEDIYLSPLSSTTLNKRSKVNAFGNA